MKNTTDIFIRDHKETYNTIISGKELSIIYFYDIGNKYNSSVLYKIGDREQIEKIYNNRREAFKKMENVGVRYEMFSINTDNITQEEVDRLFNNSGYINRFLKENNL